MSEQIGANGNEITITIPSSGERDWATSIRDNCFATISSHTHQGTGAGAKLVGYLAFDQTEALITNNVTLKARNNAANGTIDIAKVDTNDEVVLSTIVVSAEFEDAGLTVVDDGDNTKKIALDASAITTATTRVLTMADEAVDLAALKNSNISATAAIALSKLAALTASEMVISDGSGVIVSAPVATYPSLTELSYVKGLTSAVQNQINTKTDTGTANEITLTGTVIGLADNPVVPGTDSMVVPAGTTAQRVSTTDGSFRFNSDLSSFEGYKSGAWSSIGGGGGGLDVYHEEDFSVNGSADFTSGNDATPDAAGTGTLDGTLSDDASTQIAGTESLKYTMSTSSTNDFFINDADISLDTKQVSNFTGVDFYYKYDGDDDDIRFIVLDQDDAELTATNEYLKNATVATRFSTNIYIPAGSTGVRYGFQVVTGNDTKILLVDDIQLTTNPGVYKNLTETGFAHYHTMTGYGSTNTRIPYFTTEVANDPNGLFTIANDSTNGFSITINEPCEIDLTYALSFSAAGYAGISLNSSSLTTDVQSIPVAEQLSVQYVPANNAPAAVAVTGKFAAGDVLRPHNNSAGYYGSTGTSTILIKATKTAEHVITPAKSNTEVYRCTDFIGYSSANLAVPYFGTVSENTISSATGTITNDSTDGFTFTATQKCIITMTHRNASTTAAYTGISKNATAAELDTGIHTIAEEKIVGLGYQNSANSTGEATYSGVLEVGDTLAAHLTTGETPYSVAGLQGVVIAVTPYNVSFLAAIPTNVQNNATDYTTESGITIEGTTTDPTKPTTVDKEEIIWAQCGQNIKATYKYYAASTTGSAAGSGDYLYTLPNGLSFDSNVVDYYATVEGSGTWTIVNSQSIGQGFYGEASGQYTIYAIPYDATRFRLFSNKYASNGAVGSGFVSLTTVKNFSIQIDAPINGWTSAGTFLSATPKNKTAYIKDVKAANTAGGTFTSGAWRTRDLNTVSGDTEIVTLSSNQFTLAAGKYEIEVEAPAYAVVGNVAKLYNITDASDAEIGTVEYASNAYQGHPKSSIKGNIEITSSKTFEIQHRCATTVSTNGFGVPANLGVSEIYTQVKITKIP